MSTRSVLAEMLSDQGLDALDDIRELKGVRDYVVSSVTEQLKDQEVDLDTRWEIYLAIEEFLPVHVWVAHLPCLDAEDVNWYDDFNLERGATELYSDVVRNIVDSQEWSASHKNDGYGDDSRWEDFDINVLKEEILQTGEGGFVNDW